MVICKLPYKERRVIARVARLFCDLAMTGEGYEDRFRTFWRISLYVRAGFFLYRSDLETITTAMESFSEAYKVNPGFKDPDGFFKDTEKIVPKLKALL